MGDALSVGGLGWNTLRQLLVGADVSGSAGVFVSPLSLYLGLTLLRSGCGPGHATHAEIAQLLSPGRTAAGSQLVASEEQHGVAVSQLQNSLRRAAGSSNQLLIANAVWSIGVEVNPDYASRMGQLLQAVARPANSVADINAWVSTATQGLIPQLLQEGTPFNLVITNALYFKGLWQQCFDTAATRPRPFQTASGAEVTVNMMKGTFRPIAGQRHCAFADTDTFAGVRLPYKDTSLVAYAILPKNSPATAAATAACKLDLAAMLNQRHWKGLPELVVELPHFKVNSNRSLKQCLQALGVHAAFDPQLADLSRLCADRLYVSDVVQAVVVQLDEKGTEAAAATAMIAQRCAMRAPPQVVFDRPFLFLVVEEDTRTPLFMGLVTNPASGDPA